MPTKPHEPSDSSSWDDQVLAAVPTPEPTKHEATGLKPPMWMDRPITHKDHAQDLEQEAAINEFGPNRMSRDHAEEKAYQDYVGRQHTEAAAHHLSGMRSAHAAGDMESARKHSLMYGVHSKALGHDPVGPAHPSVAAFLDGNPGKVKFKPHRGDLFAIKEPPVAHKDEEKHAELGKALHAIWGGASALLKGDVVQFPGNPKPAVDRGAEAPMEQLIPVSQTPRGKEHDYSSYLPDGWTKKGHRLVVNEQPSGHAVGNVINRHGQTLSSSSFYGDHGVGHRAGAVPDAILGQVVKALEHHKSKLGKAELEKVSPPARAKEVEDLKAKGLPAHEAFGIAWKQQGEKGKPTKKGEMKASKPKVVPCSCTSYAFPHRHGSGKCGGK